MTSDDRVRDGGSPTGGDSPTGGVTPAGGGTPAREGARILIVDDERNIVTSLEFLMTRQGYQVRVARDGDEALQVAEEFRPDLVLLDVMLPGKDGYELCERLRQRHGHEMRIVMLTAKGRAGEVTKGLAVGADIYVTKPFSTRDLVAEVAGQLTAAGFGEVSGRGEGSGQLPEGP